MPRKIDDDAFNGFLAAFHKMYNMHADFVKKCDALIQKVEAPNADFVPKYDAFVGRIIKLEETLALIAVAQSQPPQAPAVLPSATDDSGPADFSDISHLILKPVGEQELLREKSLGLLLNIFLNVSE